MRVTIEEYAKRFKMSVELVRIKVRYGRLQSTIVDGTTWIELSASASLPSTTPAISLETALVLLQNCRSENTHLKSRITALESKIDSLIDDKEQMLKEERDRIETIYAARDEQLKNFLEMVNTRLLQSTPHSTVTDTTALDEEDAPEVQDARKPVELLRYLRLLDLPDETRKKIVKRFARAYGGDVRIIQQNGAFYLDFSKYDYSDLLRH